MRFVFLQLMHEKIKQITQKWGKLLDYLVH